jgi:hypothetical protein
VQFKSYGYDDYITYSYLNHTSFLFSFLFFSFTRVRQRILYASFTDLNIL